MLPVDLNQYVVLSPTVCVVTVPVVETGKSELATFKRTEPEPPLPPLDQNKDGRISIIAWGWVDLTKEENSSYNHMQA